jgi:hypothetical protein
LRPGFPCWIFTPSPTSDRHLGPSSR